MSGPRSFGQPLPRPAVNRPELKFPFPDEQITDWMRRAAINPALIHNQDGTTSSVRSEYVTGEEDGRKVAYLYPRIRMVDGKLTEFDPKGAFAASIDADDFLRFYGDDAGDQADAFSKKFSDWLGSEEVRRHKGLLK